MDVHGKGEKKNGCMRWGNLGGMGHIRVFWHQYGRKCLYTCICSFLAFQFECKHTSHHLVQDHINKDVASCSAYSTTTMNHYWAGTATETLVHLPNNDKQNRKMTNGSFDMKQP